MGLHNFDAAEDKFVYTKCRSIDVQSQSNNGFRQTDNDEASTQRPHSTHSILTMNIVETMSDLWHASCLQDTYSRAASQSHATSIYDSHLLFPQHYTI
jgi:hypothetical protein